MTTQQPIKNTKDSWEKLSLAGEQQTNQMNIFCTYCTLTKSKPNTEKKNAYLLKNDHNSSIKCELYFFFENQKWITMHGYRSK